MTDRVNYLTVALERDIRDDDIEPLITAISMLRHVLKVEINVVSANDWLAEERARSTITKKIMDVLFERKSIP